MPNGVIEVNGTTYKLDARPSHRDLNDWEFKITGDIAIPDNIDLLPWFDYDQGQEGSCTGNAQAKVFRLTSKQQGLPDFHPSRSFIYYNSRMIEGTTGQDAGSTIGDSIKGLVTYGACSEEDFAYIPGQYALKPSPDNYTKGLDHQALKYESVGQTADMIGAALALGHAVSFGFVVYENFEMVGSNGMVPMPAGGILGGHNMCITGRINSRRLYICDNSWLNWGLSGPTAIPNTCNSRCYIPYDFIHNPNIVFEIKTIDMIEGTPTPPPANRLMDGIGILLDNNTVQQIWPVTMPITNRVKGIGIHYDDGYATEVWHA